MADIDSRDNGQSSEELPEAVVDEAERLTRLARRATDDDEAALYRRERDRLLEEYGFAPRFREDDDTLVCYPSEWIEDGTARIDRIEETDRASEIPLSGPGDPDRYDEVETHNAEIVEAVADQYGPVHGANARAFADFMGDHYVKQVERATADEIAEFKTEYFPRNAWPSDEQRDRIAQSLAYVFEVADASLPPGTQLSGESK
ncbi:Uncharacterized protein AArcCO_0071 [Halalkaliarchaeum sp. AArc-CO]|uniref:DUF7108 family protein n=1 Tax=Halalkaliarchaeum sp. AArc-CO TaxID=2866381 RepID=UPI00217F209A|nr:rnhA operon protein [Halalkaliarchaeum sp. AArc-CO]UWG49403.1 Uncharacterized protein AArcCO_0071 [Halalkaliarchaeum sp. AArc-CO]